MEYLSNIFFTSLLLFFTGLFALNFKKIISNISLGKEKFPSDNKAQRLIQTIKVALGQSKMTRRPISGILHIVVYIGFIIINIELIEIVIDGILGTHRVLAFLGGFYDFIIASFEILATGVIISIVIFWIRRNITRIKRFISPEMKGWPKNDANLILYFELVLMGLFLLMNSSDLVLQKANYDGYIQAGNFPVSSLFISIFDGVEISHVFLIERISWWLHIVGILIFLNYLYYSKHLHIILAFPNVFYSKLNKLGKLNTPPHIKEEVEKMLLDPYGENSSSSNEEPKKLGASDIFDLSKVQLLNSYSCTECGRCTSVCPANQTGKKLSPRKIMMDVRDRMESIGRNIKKNKGKFIDDKKNLFDNISKEELWACTSCNACTSECPIMIDPLSIIIDLRRYLVMEESSAPSELNIMMSNIENNGAPWKYNQQDRLNWIDKN